MGETIRASEQQPYHGLKRVSCVESFTEIGCLVLRPSLADVSRIGRLNGKGNLWQGQFLVALFVSRFPIMDLTPGLTPATLNRNC